MDLCQLDELKLSCFGCCGNSFKSRDKVMHDIRKNSLANKSFEERGKEHELLRSSGICRSVVIKGRRIVCDAHPGINGKDYRDKACDKGYRCETIKEFDRWSNKKKKEFVEFLRKKRLDHYEYSMGIDKGSFLKEFGATRK